MSPQFQNLMLEATRLTRGGDPMSAQAVIQRALRQAQSHLPEDSPGRAPLDQAIDVIARLLPETPSALAPSAAPIHPAGTTAHANAGRFSAGTHAAAGLRCDYKLFVPANTAGRAMPLVVMLHGCTQNPDDFAAGTRMNELAAAQGFMVLYPAQSQRMNPQRCWNWFKHSHQARGRGEPALIASLTRQVMSEHPVDARRVYVAGLSAGGAMAAILAQTYPELFAAAGVHSGLAAGSASDLPSALAAMKSGAGGKLQATCATPIIVFHGDADATVHPTNGEDVVASSARARSSTQARVNARPGARSATRRVHLAADGEVVAEHWVVHGAGHAWAGGSPQGSYTDSRGPDASAEMLRFFLEHPGRAG